MDSLINTPLVLHKTVFFNSGSPQAVHIKEKVQNEFMLKALNVIGQLRHAKKKKTNKTIFSGIYFHIKLHIKHISS